MSQPKEQQLIFTISDNFLKPDPGMNRNEMIDTPERYISLISNPGDLLFESVFEQLPPCVIKSNAAYSVGEKLLMPYPDNNAQILEPTN